MAKGTALGLSVGGKKKVEQRGSGKAPTSRTALTVKLDEPDYEALRLYAFERRLSHQDVIEAAVKSYLKGK